MEGNPPPMTEQTITIQDVRVRGKAWWKLGEIAEKRQLSIGQLISTIAESAVAEERPVGRFGRLATPMERRKMTPRRLDRLRELHALGMSDGEIATDIEMSAETVRTWRNQLELPVIRRTARTMNELANPKGQQ